MYHQVQAARLSRALFLADKMQVPSIAAGVNEHPKVIVDCTTDLVENMDIVMHMMMRGLWGLTFSCDGAMLMPG